nr:hypothetical protein [Tanacetum cinerariifolium]
MATFKVFDELIKITGLTNLHKRMRFWFVQEIAEEEGLLKVLHVRYDNLRRKSARRYVLIRDMKALGERGDVDDIEFRYVWFLEKMKVKNEIGRKGESTRQRD